MKIVKIAYFVSMVTEKLGIVPHDFLYNLIELVLKYHDIFMDLIECPAKKNIWP